MGDKVVADQLSEKNDINMVMVYSALASMLDSNPMVGSMPIRAGSFAIPPCRTRTRRASRK